MDKIKTKIPPPVITLCFGLIMWAMSLYFPYFSFEEFGFFEEPKLFLIAIVCIAFGLCLDVVSFINFLKHKTTVNPIRPEKASALVINGFYRFTRNPMYLGMAFILTGSALLFANIGSLLVLPFFIACMNYLQIKPEEKILENIFKEGYLEYKKTVRRWL